jgi:hypothetical protein
MIEKIEFDGKVFALISRHDQAQDGVNFVTPPSNPLQVGILKHRQGAKVKPHTHRKLPRTIDEVQEVLYIEYGELETDFYDESGCKLGSVILKAGDTILLISGGHGFNILQDCKIVEVKQGPYSGVEEDKEWLSTTY